MKHGDEAGERAGAVAALPAERLTEYVRLLGRVLERPGEGLSAVGIRDLRESLGRVRFASDGTVEPESLDAELRRLIVNTEAGTGVSFVKEWSSLHDIQAEYFDAVDRCFGDLRRVMLRGGGQPTHFAAWLANDDSKVRAFAPIVREFQDTVAEYWREWCPVPASLPGSRPPNLILSSLVPMADTDRHVWDTHGR